MIFRDQRERDQPRLVEVRELDPEGFDASAWRGAWLDKANLALAGKRPAEYLDTNEGGQIVQRLLAQMERGAYA